MEFFCGKHFSYLLVGVFILFLTSSQAMIHDQPNGKPNKCNFSMNGKIMNDKIMNDKIMKV